MNLLEQLLSQQKTGWAKGLFGRGYPDTRHLLPRLFFFFFNILSVMDGRWEVYRSLGACRAEYLSFQCIGLR